MSDALAAKVLEYPFGNAGIDPLLPKLGADGVGMYGSYYVTQVCPAM